jgi:hypothetical protein
MIAEGRLRLIFLQPFTSALVARILRDIGKNVGGL